MNPIRKAVFPVAGLGSRFLPATKAQPKEMLCVVDKPLIQYAVEEAYQSGVRHMIFVTGRNKRAIEDHFDVAYELETELANANKHDLLAAVRRVQPDDMLCSYVRQPRALGLGHAILCAEHLVGNEAFAVLLADDLMRGNPPALKQLIDQYAQDGASVVGVHAIADHETQSYGVVGGTVINERLQRLSQIIEKPATADAPSRWGVVGRYVLVPRIFDLLRTTERGTGGEIQLTDAIAGLLTHEPVHALACKARRFDCGSKLGYLQATVELALEHPELAAPFAGWLKSRSSQPD
jgi:UTP--glucose-1-phosphate uridylyltransferase